MPALDDVTQRFVADTAPYIAAVRAAANAARDFAAANLEAAAAVRELQDAMNGLAGNSAGTALALQGAVGAENDMRDVTLLLQAVLQELRDQTLLLGVAFTYLDDKLADLVGHAAAAKAALNSIGDAMSSLAVKTVAAGATQQAAQGLWIGGWRLTGNAIHWIISGLVEFLAVALPAAIAAAAGAFVLYQGVVEQVGVRLQSLYTATEATANIFHQTTGDVLGLGNAFQTAQNQANPIAYQLLGNYILIARQHMGDFAAAGLQVADALRELGSRIQVDLLQHGQELDQLLAHMVTDLIQFGQIFGNLGHALLNFAADMPGLAEKLLAIADAISKVILWISELPHWLILSFAAFEEFNRWGGLVVGMLGRFGLANEALAPGILSVTRGVGILRAALMLIPALLFNIGSGISLLGGSLPLVGEGAEDAGGALARFGGGLGVAVAGLSAWEVVGVAAAAAGIGILVDKIITAKDATQDFTTSLEKSISQSSNINALTTITQGLSAVSQQMSKTSQTSVQFIGASSRVALATRNQNSDYLTLTSTQKQMIGQFSSVVDGADKISRAYGLNFSQALGLADVAGVKLANTQITLGKNANIAGAEIESLVAGYKGLDQVGGALGTDMNALAIQSGLAGTKVSSLNSALDQFVQNGTSVTNGLATMNQDLTQIGNVGVAVGGAFEVFHGQVALAVDAAAKSLQSFSGTGAQTWQNYNAAINQAQQLTDSFRVAAAYGGVSTTQFTGAIANTVASLLPFTTHSATAVSELSMIAQEAGGPATSNFQTLKKWVDENGVSGSEFNKIMQTMTSQMDNAGSAAKEFASDLQSEMQSQMASALLSANNLNGAVKNFQTAVINAGGSISAKSPAYQALYGMLTAAGLSAKQAKNELQLMQNTIDAMHSKTITVGVNAVYTQSGAPPPYVGGAAIPLGVLMGKQPAQHGMTVGFASGGIVGGGSGVDAIHAMLTAGEAVLNAQAVAALGGPLGVHTLNNQPSQGVLTSGGGGGGATALGLNLTVRNEMDGQAVNSNQRQVTLIYNRRNPQNNLGLRTR